MYLEDKQRLAEIGTDIAGLSAVIPGATSRTELTDWQRDVEKDFFCVVLVGQFNRGKSSLLNTLLGKDLLPIGITPTTAVLTVLRHAEHPCFYVHSKSGEVTQLPSTTESLVSFTADGGSASADIDYVEIGLNHPLLAQGMVYVDTPGVSDLSRERQDITYRFVPRADAVVFVLDSTTPVTRSEMDFLESAVLKSGIDRLLFVSNFADLLELDDREEAISLAKCRVEEALGEHDYPVILVSAKRSSSPGGEEDPGILTLRRALVDLQEGGNRNREKFLRMRSRLIALTEALLADLANAENAARLEGTELDAQLQDLERRCQEREARIERISLWTKERENELLAMVRKSLSTFGDGLREDLQDTVSGFNGPDFKTFVETQIPLVIKRRCKAWIEGHGDAIEQLLLRISSALADGLGAEFGVRIPPLQPRISSREITTTSAANIAAPDLTDARLIAGILVGGAGALMMLMGAGIMYPMVALAGFPFISNGLEKKRLQLAKQAFAPELNATLDDICERFGSEVLARVQTDLHGLQLAAEDKYRELLDGAMQQVQQEKSIRQEPVALVRDRRLELQELRKKLEECKDRLNSFYETGRAVTA